MSWRSIHFGLCFAGIAIASYSLYVEAMLVDIPGYTPSCDISGWHMSCSRVFQSPYSHILVHWGLVKRGSALDLSLPQLAIIYFLVMMVLPEFPQAGRLTRGLSYLAGGFNLYLALVLKFVLGEVCPVCISNYIVNLGLLVSVNRITRQSYASKRD